MVSVHNHQCIPRRWKDNLDKAQAQIKPKPHINQNTVSTLTTEKKM